MSFIYQFASLLLISNDGLAYFPESYLILEALSIPLDRSNC